MFLLDFPASLLMLIPGFIMGAAAMAGLYHLRRHPEIVPDELEDILKIATQHEHDYRIAGRRGSEIQKECSVCKRTIYVSRDQPPGTRL